MKSNTKVNIIITSCLFLAFIVFTILVKVVDVQSVGPNGSEVGFASVNEAVFKVFGYNQTLYDVTEILGLVTFLIIGFFAVLGLYQLIKGKSIKKVDYKILVLGCFYVIVLLFYVLFEIIVINHRPVLIDGELEASYPSSHTMLSICVVTSAIVVLSEILENRKALRLTIVVIGYALIAFTVAGRLLSGVHWFTDIVGAMLLSFALVMLFYSALDFIKDKIK